MEEHVIKHPERAEADRFFNYPYPAVEEALANAVYHNGYDVREPIEVRVHADGIIILSHPGADRSVSREGLREFRVFNRCYRNRRIGEFLKELHPTEGRNTGFQKIISALKENDSPMPLFETDEARTFFSTTLFIHPYLNDANRDANRDAKRSAKRKRRQSKRNGVLSPLELSILNCIKKNPSISASKTASQIGKSRSTVQRGLKRMVSIGVLRREGGTRGKWVILVIK